MYNSPLLGSILLVVIALSAWASWRSFKNQKYTFAIGLIVLIGLLLKVYMSSDLFLHPWDERYHALVAKNMLNHPLVPTLFDKPILEYDYKMWTYNHIWLHKQPVPLWGIMSSLAVFGVNSFAVRLPSILLTSLGTIISYRFGKQLFSRRVGLFAAVFYATNGLILEISSGRVATDHIDIFFLFFIQLAIYLGWEFAQRKSLFLNILCGIAIGLAVLSKWLPALIVLPIWGAFLLYSKRFSFKEILAHGLVLCAAIAAVVLPWQLYIHSEFPLEAAWESTFNSKHVFETLDVSVQPWYYHFTMLRINYGELIYLPLIWFAYKTIRKRTNWKYWALFIWIAVPYIFFSIVMTKMQGYTVFAAPAVFLVLALFIDFLIRFRKRFNYRWVPILGVVALIALPIRFTIERAKPFQTVNSPDWQNDITELSDQINQQEKVVVFNVNRPIELMFHSNCTAYNTIPSSEKMQALIVEGYTVYVNQESDLELEEIQTIWYPSLTE
ncbi:MAG: glycosyltransferase family 39 protein [Crocinitomicaceae bacterium]|nr:glycosyltransferase family 39 protein [Crocinitomicaceae bacterium]